MATKDESGTAGQIEEDLDALNQRIADDAKAATSPDAMNPPDAAAKKS